MSSCTACRLDSAEQTAAHYGSINSMWVVLLGLSKNMFLIKGHGQVRDTELRSMQQGKQQQLGTAWVLCFACCAPGLVQRQGSWTGGGWTGQRIQHCV
jgi:hypothetical protein